MAEIKPFSPLRFNADNTAIRTLVSPPYDIVSPSERAELLVKNAHNIIRVELPEGDGEAKYAAAAKAYGEYVDSGVLVHDKTPGLFVYSEEFSVGGKEYTVYGVIGRVTLHEFSERIILPHEETLTKAKQDRFELMKATCANISPIYALYSDASGITDTILKKAMEQTPLYRFTDDDGIAHSLFKIEAGSFTDEFARVLADKQLFIADGHHRYETALRYKHHLEQQHSLDGTAADSQMILLVEMDNPGLVVFPTHRLIKAPVKLTSEGIIAKAKEYFEIAAVSGDAVQALEGCGDAAGCYIFCAKDGKYLLRLRDDSVMQKLLPGKSEAYATLDVTILHTLILEGILGIDREDMALGKSLAYTRDMNEALEAPYNGGGEMSFILNATKVSQIKDVSLAGEKMPQKSTYFYPKPVTGLVINDLKSLQ
ncbi:MAG TPA: DUF1015 domain-containing protein [Bacillota bacterium]|nr:DUF1015 domain-containing protein [Bacillota bacterium]